jgi:hypothetical protein
MQQTLTWHNRQPNPTNRPAPPADQPREWHKGWLIIGSLTGLLLLWLAYRWLFSPAWLDWLHPPCCERA